ncbi:hypothetical protein PIB30_036955 [Stylosanthes scabra]|uniref:Uncharacterized protein n=1 Tax=Stylosanthes scabra TaxID=79078 RepID=A0ABU6VD72_9FABA|nr:hypothetical protein [Stylosanthes scabra]
MDLKKLMAIAEEMEQVSAATETDLKEANIEIQMLGMPKHCKKTQLGRKIAATMDRVSECEIYEATRTQVRFLTATVTLDINKPIQKGANLGYDEGNCSKSSRDEEEGNNRSKELGPWLKVNQVGVKVDIGSSKTKENTARDTNHNRNEATHKRFTEQLLAKLAGFSVVEPSGNTMGKTKTIPLINPFLMVYVVL